VKKIYILVAMVLMSLVALSPAWAATVPDAPSALTANAVSSSRIELTWEDNSDDESGFKIERKKSGGTYTQIATVGDDITTYSSTGLSSNTVYYYRVRAYNSAGNSAYSNEASATTMDVTPDAPSELVASTVSSSRIKLTWEDNSDNELGFKIERKKSGGSYSQIAEVDNDITTYTNTGLTNDTEYYYRVRAYNSAGNSSYSNVDSATTGVIPGKPADLEATVISSSEIKLTWEDNSTNETGFKIERKKSGGTYAQIATVGRDVTTYTNKGLTSSTKYYYRVRAYNNVGNSAYSNEDSATTLSALKAPSSLKVTAVSSSKVNLTWEDNSTNETGFKIERKKSGGTYAQIATVGRNVTTYINTGLTSSTKYYYRVRAYNSTGNSAYTSEASVTTLGDETIIRMVIGNTTYYVNNVSKSMDVAPIIMESRTLLPIRFVAEAIGAKVSWNNSERKVTITLEGTTIELWIGLNYAKVNGEFKFIDSTNIAVNPIIVAPGRTMLPLRFVSENLGAKVDWNSSKREVTVTYPAP
jgi:titin